MTDYLKARADIPAYLNANQSKFAALNTASVVRHDHGDGFSLVMDDSSRLHVTSKNSDVTIPLDSDKQGRWIDITYSKEMVLVDHKETDSSDVLLMSESDMVLNQLHLLVRIEDGQIKQTYFGKRNRKGEYPFTKKLSYSKSAIERAAASNTPYEKPFHANIQQYSQDRRRFIAHAGGMIDGKTYTNSLESLDASWESGFRLFELDIIKTSDDIFVAAHDWEQWADITNYEGALPPTRKAFLEHKIHGRYTPLDIDGINNWFTKHPEAILVTDKVHGPAEFSRAFVDKKRLMMELFSWDAVKEGVAAGIKSAMPTGSLVWSMPWAHVDHLVRLGVTDIAASRRLDSHAKNITRRLTDFGIRVYAFHVNFDPGKDEVYVTCQERDLFYGMYADKWDFESTPKCHSTSPSKAEHLSSGCLMDNSTLASPPPDKQEPVECEISEGAISDITIKPGRALLVGYCKSVVLRPPFTVESGGALTIKPSTNACSP